MCHLLPVPFQRHPPLVAGATTLPGGKRVTGFSVALWLPTARLSPTHWILRSLPLPLRIQFAGVTPVPLPPPAPLGSLWVLGISGSRCLWQRRQKKPYNRASSVGRFIGRSFCVQAKDKLRPTWRPSAGSPQQKCTPSAACGGVSPRESMSLDSQVALLPYESSSFATPEGEILAALSFVQLMKLDGKRRANFPLRGKYRRRRG